jgi:hypothetical protein
MLVITNEDSLEINYKSHFSDAILCLLLLYLVYLFSLNCSLNAPRDNPLDPNLGGNIWGRVTSRNAYEIADVEVFIPFADAITYTDTCGEFSLYVLPEDSMYIFFVHENYALESTMVVPEKGKIDTLTMELNGLPYFTEYEATTHYYDRNLPADPLYFCELSTIAGDIDGEIDIDSVWVEIPDLSYSRKLDYDLDEQKFIYTLYTDELPGQTLEALVGEAIFFNIADKGGAIVQSPPYYIARIIYQAPGVIFPIRGTDILMFDTTFVWHKYNYGYYVSYHGEIIKIISGGPAGVVQYFNVSDQNDTTFYVNISILNLGEYYWTLEVIDDFGNSARSKEYRFYKE